MQHEVSPLDGTIRRPFRFTGQNRTKIMDEKDRIAPTQLPPPPESASDVAGASTLPPAAGGPPSVLEPEAITETAASKVPLAGASKEPSDFFERAYNRLVQVHEEQQRDKSDLLDPKGGFARLVGSLVENGTRSTVAQLEPRFRGIEAKVSELEKAYAQLKADTDRRLAAFEKQIADLKEQRGTGEAAAAPAG